MGLNIPLMAYSVLMLGMVAGVTACECRAILTPVATSPDHLAVAIAGGGGFCGDQAFIGIIEAYRGPTFEPLWQVESSGKKTPLLQTLIYGQVPPGYREKQAAVPLAVGDNVYINVYGPGYRGKIHVVVGPRALPPGLAQ
jgi:hypothetical protein